MRSPRVDEQAVEIQRYAVSLSVGRVLDFKLLHSKARGSDND